MIFAQTLDGAWVLRQVGCDESFTAHVPGSVHLDLMREKRIEDPFVGDNELKVSWVHECDWEYSKTFEAAPELLNGDRVFLECDGLDTIASVTLNGETLGAAENMYIPHRFNVGKKLLPGENELKIVFHSPVNHVKPLLEQDKLHAPGESLPGAPYTRKSPSQWGWDWGPKLPTSGIWKSIRLASYSVARIVDIQVHQKHRRNGSVTLDLQVYLEKFRRAICRVEITLTHPNGRVTTKQCNAIGADTKCSINIEDPELWWPNGYGDQPLYTLEARIACDDQELGTFKHRIGLRTIKLERKKDSHGRSFTFVVNGVKIFCKGANWIPADQFPTRVTDEQYRHLVSSAAKANMNMLRVWGGGIYENDVFYDLCDEYGLLVWQDFMFACSLYPVNKEFLANVQRDVEHNVIRLRDHACLALWCGNNEIEWAITGNWMNDDRPIRRKQYLKIFYELIPSIVGKLDPATPYWPSSPASDQPFEQPNGQDSGDGHFWDVWHSRQPFTAYRKQYHRFMSEFGFESLPAYETCQTFASGEDLNITSYVMECHQKNSAGNGLILHYLAQTFRMPKNFEMMCYVSQLLQAEAIRYGVEHWRRNRGRCMGTLYWQLNDCWPVSSWSSIDYYGRWKALNYVAKRFYSPIMLSVCEEGTSAQLHVTNDTAKAAKVEVRWSLERLDGKVIRKSKIKTTIDPEQNKNLASLDFSDDLSNEQTRQAVLVHELLVNGKHVSQGVTSFVPWKHLELPAAKITVEPKQDEKGSYLEVTSDNTAKYVWLAVPKKDVIFSDNYFDVPAGRKVTVRVEGELSASALARVKAYSLRDSY